MDRPGTPPSNPHIQQPPMIVYVIPCEEQRNTCQNQSKQSHIRSRELIKYKPDEKRGLFLVWNCSRRSTMNNFHYDGEKMDAAVADGDQLMHHSWRKVIVAFLFAKEISRWTFNGRVLIQFAYFTLITRHKCAQIFVLQCEVNHVVITSNFIAVQNRLDHCS